MGLRTTADEKLDEAREATDQALKALNEIVVNECWGHDEYKKEFTQQIHEAHFMLIQIRTKLSR